MIRVAPPRCSVVSRCSSFLFVLDPPGMALFRLFVSICRAAVAAAVAAAAVAVAVAVAVAANIVDVAFSFAVVAVPLPYRWCWCCCCCSCGRCCYFYRWPDLGGGKHARSRRLHAVGISGTPCYALERKRQLRKLSQRRLLRGAGDAPRPPPPAPLPFVHRPPLALLRSPSPPPPVPAASLLHFTAPTTPPAPSNTPLVYSTGYYL